MINDIYNPTTEEWPVSSRFEITLEKTLTPVKYETYDTYKEALEEATAFVIPTMFNEAYITEVETWNTGQEVEEHKAYLCHEEDEGLVIEEK